MRHRALIGAGVLVAGLVVVGVASHALVRRLVVAALGRAVDGRVTIGALSGSLWRTAEFRDVELAMPDGRPVLTASRIRVGYALTTLLRGRIVLSHVELDRPTVVLEEGADGHLNIEHLFRLLEPKGPSGRAKLVELNGVHMVDGSLTLRERPDSGGAVRVRRFHGIALDAGRIRLSHPDSAGVQADITHLAVTLSDPSVRIANAAGRVVVEGDSARFDLTRVVLPGSSGRARGTIRFGKIAPGRATVEAAGEFGRASFADFRWAAPGLPKQGGGRLALRLLLLAGGGSEWHFRGADLRSGRSHVRGSADIIVGVESGVRIDSLDMRAEPLDLALLAPFTGTLPFVGLASGRLRAAGTLEHLDVVTDLAFTDEAVPGDPQSRIAGTGAVSVGGPDVIAFRRFTLNSSDVALATVARLAPPVTLQGRVALSGTLDGPWRDASFAGTIRHTDGAGASSVRGTANLTLGDTVRVDADIIADSLSFDDLAHSYPVIALRGSVAGPVRVIGPVSALAVEAALQGPGGGGVHARGSVESRDSVMRIRFRGTLDSLDLAGRLAGAPDTRLTGEWHAELVIPLADTGATTTGTFGMALTGSRVAGVELSRAGAIIALTPQRVEVDTAFVEQPGLSLVASGALGRRGQPAGQLSLVFHADTLESLEPLVSWVRGVTGADTTSGRLDVRGGGRASVRVVGTLDAWDMQVDLFSDRVAFGAQSVRNGRVSGSLRQTVRGLDFALRVAADTLKVAGLHYTGITATATGPQDSLRFHLGGAFALASSLRLDLSLTADSSGWTARLDQGSLTLPRRVWTVVGRPRVAALREWVAMDTLELRAPGGSWVRVSGRVPRAAAGDVSLEADSLPLVDLFALAQLDTTGIDGMLSGAVRLSGQAADPSITATAAVVAGRVGDFRAPLVNVTADYRAKRLTFRAGLRSEREQVLTASGTLPLDLALTGVARRRLPDSLQLRVQADSVDLAVLDALTSAVRDVRGQFSAGVEVGGTWAKPAFQGRVYISGGAATIPALGVRYTGVETRLALTGDRLTIEEAHLKGGSGTLDATGEVRFEAGSRPTLDLTLTARGFAAFTQRSFAGLTASGEVRLAGPALGATLSGRVTVDAGFLAFADLIEKRIVNLDDPEFRALVDSNLAGATDLAPGAQSVFLDSLRIRGLTVALGPDVWLRSHEANIQLAGEFTVAKEVEDGVPRYRLDGELRAERGTYRLVVGPASKEFRVTRGTVRFFGTPDLNPDLNIVAEYTVRAVQGNDVVVRTVIGGTLLAPRLSLESDQRPPLSQAEIVAYLLFGRPSFDLVSGGAATGSGSQQAMFQGALALAGVLSGELEQTLVANLGIPLDYIAIRPGGGSYGDILGSAHVEAGTQIGERTFLTLNAGLCQVSRGLSSQVLGASVQYRIARRWSMEASVEPTVQECRPTGFLIRPPAPYQIGLDLFWQSGIQ